MAIDIPAMQLASSTLLAVKSLTRSRRGTGRYARTNRIEERPIMTEIKRRRVATNGMSSLFWRQVRVPSSSWCTAFRISYSWRHQLPALRRVTTRSRPICEATARVICQRTSPLTISGTSPTTFWASNALGYEQAVVIGHDWGAPTAWNCALLDPQTVRAVGALSVPFSPAAQSHRLGC